MRGRGFDSRREDRGGAREEPQRGRGGPGRGRGVAGAGRGARSRGGPVGEGAGAAFDAADITLDPGPDAERVPPSVPSPEPTPSVEEPARAPFPAKRVYGHAPAEGADEAVVERIRKVMAAEKLRRRTDKANLAGRVYTERARFPVDATRESLAETEEGRAFLSNFDSGGEWPKAWENLQVTRERVLEQLGPEFEPKDDDSTHETKIMHGGKHVYTLYRGASAWREADPGADSTPSSSSSSAVASSSSSGGPSHLAPVVRRLLTKLGGGAKQYVPDDAGVPTPRFGFGIKDEDQLDILRRGEWLRGLHVAEGRDIMTAHRHELKELRRQVPGRSAALTEDEMLVHHQIKGSTKSSRNMLASQRGVSLAATSAPLLGNYGAPFATANPAARKLKIDYARVPQRDPGHPVPGLRNFYQRIPGYEAQAVRAPAWGKWTAAETQEKFDWSTRKNREAYVPRLHRSQVVGAAEVSPLETMGYKAEGWSEADIAREYERVRRRPDTDYGPL